MKEPEFLTNAKGERIKVVIDVTEYEKLIEDAEDREDVRAYDKAKASGDEAIPLEQALAENRRNRK